MSDTDDSGDFQTAFWSAKHALAHASAVAFAQEDGLSPGEVARRLGLATPTVTRAATRMEATGLLRREPHPTDRRLVRLRLTDRGRELEKVIDEQTNQLTERALATLGAAERESLVRALHEIRRNLSAD